MPGWLLQKHPDATFKGQKIGIETVRTAAR